MEKDLVCDVQLGYYVRSQPNIKSSKGTYNNVHRGKRGVQNREVAENGEIPAEVEE